MLASGGLFAAQADAGLCDGSARQALRLGVIGCGLSAQEGLKRLLGLGEGIPNWRVAAMADWFPNAVQRLARTIRSVDANRMPTDVTRFTGPDAALELLSKSDLDFVLIALPPGGKPGRLCQSDLVGAAITTGHSVWCENPFAVSASQLAQVRQAVMASREKRLSFHAAFAFLDEERAAIMSRVAFDAEPSEVRTQLGNLIGEAIGLRFQVTSTELKQGTSENTLLRHCLPAFVALGNLVEDTPRSIICQTGAHVEAIDSGDVRQLRVGALKHSGEQGGLNTMIDLVYPNGTDAQVRCVRESETSLPRTWLLRGREGDIDLLHRRWKRAGDDRWCDLASTASAIFQGIPDEFRIPSRPAALARFVVRIGENAVWRQVTDATPVAVEDDWELSARILEPMIACQRALRG